VHTGVVVFKLLSRAESLDSSLVQVGRVRVSLPAERERSLSTVGFSRYKVDSRFVFAESSLNVVKRLIEDVSVPDHRHEGLSGDDTVTGQNFIAVLVEFNTVARLREAVRDAVRRLNNYNIEFFLVSIFDILFSVAHHDL
jgi:hypothetical protein